jgi:hypothetical protein
MKGYLLLQLLVFSLVYIYLKMTLPKPYSKDVINNSVLAVDGSDFPYKLQPGAF